MTDIRFINKSYESGYDHESIEIAVYEAFKKGLSPSTFWIFKNPYAIYVLKDAATAFLDITYAKTTKYPIIRTPVFNRSNASIITSGTGYNLTVIADGELFNNNVTTLYNFISSYWIDIISDYNLSVNVGKNDIVVSGTDRKLTGFTAEIETLPDGRTIALSNGMVTDTFPDEIDVDKLYNLPEEKWIDKKTKKPSDRITSIYDETGTNINPVTFESKSKIIIENYLKKSVTIDNDFSDYEKTQSLDNIKLLINDDWNLYGKY